MGKRNKHEPSHSFLLEASLLLNDVNPVNPVRPFELVYGSRTLSKFCL